MAYQQNLDVTDDNAFREDDHTGAGEVHYLTLRCYGTLEYCEGKVAEKSSLECWTHKPFDTL